MFLNHFPGPSSGSSSHSPSPKWALAAIVCTALSIVVFGPSATCADAEDPQADLYVAVYGNDAWTGTLSEPNADESDGPFATISRARDAVRALKAKGPLTKPMTVMVREGTYYLNETLCVQGQLPQEPRDVCLGSDWRWQPGDR